MPWAEIYLSSIANGNKADITHTPTFACPTTFFTILADARVSEMAFQDRGWDHVCKTGGQEERAFVLAESCM
jgi:hypothetical protein